MTADALQRFEVWFGCLFAGIGLVALVIAASLLPPSGPAAPLAVQAGSSERIAAAN